MQITSRIVTAVMLILLALQLRPIVSRPRTVVRGDAERAVLLLRDARRAIPRGATVAFIRPAHRDAANDNVSLLVATAELPQHVVVPFARNPEFVIAFDAPLDDPRYVPAGHALYRMRR